jgi:protoheme ferro-lyase
VKHVVLVTYGEPTSPSFVDQLVYSWRILLGLTRSVADIPAPLIPIIALSRGRGRTALWKKYGYSSPLEPITLAQAAQLRSSLAEQLHGEWKIHVAYEFRVPLLADVIRRIPEDEPVFVAPMYAADSAFTHELSRRTIEPLDDSRRAPITVLPAIDVETLASISVRHVLDFVGGAPQPNTALVLAAHGTLLNPARPIETGRIDTEQLCERITQQLSSSFAMVRNGWLNHTRGGKWTEPPMEECLKHVADAGIRDVVYYPYGFLADNAESQLEGRMMAEGQPDLRVRFVPCLNGSPALADVIARQIAASTFSAPSGTRASLQDPVRVPV